GIRRIHLPTDFDPGGYRCDEGVGRYCYWYEPFDDSVPQESKAVVRARERLLRDLAAAGERLPGDGWIVGQLVRYLVEQGPVDSAIMMAQRCQAARWWCAALEGFSRHMAHDYEGADDAFGRALREMPEAERCTWTDLTLLLGDNDRRYRTLPCAERRSA